MRNLLGLGLLALAIAGCRTEAEEKAELTRAASDGCVRGLEAREAELPKAVPAGLDKQRFCDCVTSKTFAGKDLQQLRERREGRPGADEVEAMGACVIAEAERAGVIKR